MLGAQLGQYQILEQVGAGTQATVYRAYHEAVDRYVAIKVIPRHFASDATFVGRFRQEAQLVARLEHPHILPVYDFGEEQGVAFIVMRYLEAGTLKDIMSERSLPLADSGHLLCQLASALDYAHRQGVVHRDIKPANIMVDREGNSYLTDFGVAKIVEGGSGLTASGTIGTPAYMSPEQGMAGRLPYGGDSAMAVILKHMNDPVPMVREQFPNVPAAIEQVIATAMAKEPDNRYQAADEFCEALEVAVSEAVGLEEPEMLREAAELAFETMISRREDETEIAAGTGIFMGTQPGRGGVSPLLLGVGGALAVAVVAGVLLLTGVLGGAGGIEDDGSQDVAGDGETTAEGEPEVDAGEESGGVAVTDGGGDEQASEPGGDSGEIVVEEVVAAPTGRLPYINDMEAANVLEGWAVSGDWQVVSDAGNHVLFSDVNGSALTILNDIQPLPEWVSAESYLITMRVKLDLGGAARLLFSQSSSDDFYSLDFSGRNVILERIENGQNTTAQAESTGIPLQLGRWYDLWVWRDGQQVSVYVNGQWYLQTLDLPSLPPGAMSLQTTGSGGVFIDEITVSVPHEASDRFEDGAFPATWRVASGVSLTRGPNSQMIGGRNLGTDDVEPITGDLSNFTLACEVLVRSGQGALQFRKSSVGRYEVALEGGNVSLMRVITRAPDVTLGESRNIYGTASSNTIVVQALEEHLRVTFGGQLVAEVDDPDGYLAGTVALEFGDVSDFWFDDCVIFEQLRPSNAAGSFVTDLWESLLVAAGSTARPDVTDDFAELCGNCWVGTADTPQEGPG